MKKIVFLHLFIFIAGVAKAQLRITEVMQSNVDCVLDDLNQFPDSWVELYNSTSETENLNAYKIGLTDNPSEAWQLTSQTVNGKSYILVYCDKEGTNLHADFRLETGEGGAVYLFKNGTIVDKLENIPAQPSPNVSYGRKDDSPAEWGWQATPTPKATNCGKICTEVLSDPIFSVEGFVKPEKATTRLQLRKPEGTPEEAVIRYTTDGTEPTETSQEYSSAIVIRTNRIVRARMFCDGYVSPRSVSQSYIFHERDITLPVVSIITDQSYFYDTKKGIYVEGSYSVDKKNYEYDWRRPINIEYFVPEEEKSVINQLGETRVSGAASRSCKLKSLIVYANKRFGKKRLKYEFFPEQRPGINKFKSIMLRNSGNDFDYLYFRDAAIQRSVAENVDLDYQAYKPAIFYLNGEYMGMLNVRERSNDDNVWSNYDGLEDIDMFENSELKAGDWTEYNNFRSFYKGSHSYAEYDELMEMEEYQNLMLMNLYYSNLDFPGNNIVIWRKREEGSKWRWISKDTDFGLGLYGANPNYNTIDWLYNPNYDSSHAWGANSESATLLFRQLMDIGQFRWEFLDKAAVYTGTFLSADSVKALLTEMADVISYEYPNHRKLINEWWPNYSNELTNAKNYITNRLTYFMKYLSQKYGCGTPLQGKVNDQLSRDDRAVVNVTVNGIPVKGGYMNGQVFDKRPLQLKGECTDESRVVKGWTVKAVSKSGAVNTTDYEGADISFTPSNHSLVTFNAILGEATGIDEVETTDKEILYIYDTAGCRLPELRKGINIVKYTDGTTRKIDIR